MALHQRLLRDIAELQAKPYPNIILFPWEDKITQACLILAPNGGRPLHLTIDFSVDYPLKAPRVTIQSKIAHPNVFNSMNGYICASILNTDEGYTPAYTLKGISIQLLSFFSSDKLEQSHGGVQDLVAYKKRNKSDYGNLPSHKCQQCLFPNHPQPAAITNVLPIPLTPSRANQRRTESRSQPNERASPKKSEIGGLFSKDVFKFKMSMMQPALPVDPIVSLQKPAPKFPTHDIYRLPDEILLLICSNLEDEDLLILARTWSRVGSRHGVMTKFDIMRTRELQCFTLKQPFTTTTLGVGVAIVSRGRQGSLESEFDLLSEQAFKEFRVRKSVQGLPFAHWLPLAISRRHYNSVKDLVIQNLLSIGVAASVHPANPTMVLYAFMNDVVVKLSREATESLDAHPSRAGSLSLYYNFESSAKSTLARASEKAIESYYSLFHLLLCLATADDSIVREANTLLDSFLQGLTSKSVCPNLGYLLIAALIADVELSEKLQMAIIRETITRNVVWMMDVRGAGMAELSHMEPDGEVSEYRLKKTFEASLTSYRLLMFLNLFRRTIDRGTGQGRKTLVQLRESIFDAHGAPPRGTASRLTADVKRLHAVDSFSGFLKEMGVPVPTKEVFCRVLRNCVRDSVEAGYSVWALAPVQAKKLREERESGVGTTQGLHMMRGKTFFPAKGGTGGRKREGRCRRCGYLLEARCRCSQGQ